MIFLLSCFFSFYFFNKFLLPFSLFIDFYCILISGLSLCYHCYCPIKKVVVFSSLSDAFLFSKWGSTLIKDWSLTSSSHKTLSQLLFGTQWAVQIIEALCCAVRTLITALLSYHNTKQSHFSCFTLSSLFSHPKFQTQPFSSLKV